MKRRTLGELLLLGAVAVAPANAGDTYRISPAETSALGIPVATLDRHWAAVSLVNEQNLPPDAKEDLAHATDSRFRFVVDGDLNGDGRPDRAVVGVYRTRKGEEGQFLLIVTRGASGAWNVSYLSKLPGFPRPSLLYPASDSLTWSPCVACDAFAIVSWKHGHYRTDWAKADVE